MWYISVVPFNIWQASKLDMTQTEYEDYIMDPPKKEFRLLDFNSRCSHRMVGCTSPQCLGTPQLGRPCTPLEKNGGEIGKFKSQIDQLWVLPSLSRPPLALYTKALPPFCRPLSAPEHAWYSHPSQNVAKHEKLMCTTIANLFIDAAYLSAVVPGHQHAHISLNVFRHIVANLWIGWCCDAGCFWQREV